MKPNTDGGARCPKCNSSATGVADTRPVVRNGIPCVYRRRACEACGETFRTFEMSENLLDSPKAHTKTIHKVFEQLIAQACEGLEP